MRQLQILCNAYILHACLQNYVSGLTISDMSDLIVGSRSKEWAQTFGKSMVDQEFQRTHALFSAVGEHLRESTDECGSRATCTPFLVRCGDSSPLITFGTTELQMAIERDFLDAGEGSINESKGWRMNPVRKTATAREGNSHAFMDARVSFADVKAAKGTVIFNSAGAYISSTLAKTSLAALDGLNGLYAGVCLNMYVTRGDAKVSAPPHTDKQDVIVMQTQGRKHWKVYSPPDNRFKPTADPFARGKGADDLPLQLLEESGSKLIFEATLNPGDVLFVPSRFPHTTDTLSCYEDDPDKHFDVDDWSIHLTVGLDSHVWSMNYLSMRRMGLLKYGLVDVLAHNENDTKNLDVNYACMKVVNNLSQELREHLFSSINAGDLLVGDTKKGTKALIQGTSSAARLANELFLLNKRVNAEMDVKYQDETTLSLDQCGAIVTKFCTVGQEIHNTHREMYVAAVEEEQIRRTEATWVADDNMTKEQIERLGIFRVPKFFERLDFCRNDLQEWATAERYCNAPELPIILKGDQVEVNLPGVVNGPWSPAKIVMARPDGLFDIQFFNGMMTRGIARQAIKGPYGIGIFI